VQLVVLPQTSENRIFEIEIEHGGYR
jgi:hypothetical protein